MLAFLALYRRVIAALLIVVPMLGGWLGVSILPDDLNAVFGPLGVIVEQANEMVAAALIVWSKIADARAKAAVQKAP